ncbi:cupin domain-containing protein [Chelativorans sp.]|uniref:cupin domain-containing protein n=1 Tax=Chelativorans sp. TaxID=2203393 RepID=UPI0028116B59|nr:cupin domain-containing protein [Chelativorans sp.]
MHEVIDPKTLFLEEDELVPNNPVFPVLIYLQVLDRQAEAKDRIFQDRFAANGWAGIWRNGIFTYHHFHPDAHEALGIARGRVEVQLGGPSGQRLSLQEGDLLVLPAGTGHRNLSASEDLLVIGAYPKGQEEYTTLREKIARAAVAKVPRPQTDPFYGKDGPLLRAW